MGLALMKTNISCNSRKGPKGVQEEDTTTLASKVKTREVSR